ncbi:MAG: CDP-alcohol phosphatidyltransferase family protein [Polyangiaceae bacterium]|nr:CDP-alcohol phosphatidyltransferase family protein [Polyangiaceae bacterium]
MGFWSGYRAALKPLDIEEPIDVYVHRPAGYVIAKLCFPTPVTPNQLTVGAILLGVTGGVLLAVSSLPYHLQIGAALLFLSTAFDCADGMLARMRKSSSVIGRMLDGIADLFTIVATIGGSIAVLVARYSSPWWHTALAVGLAALTVFTSSFHSTGYDHYKNVYMRLTVPGSKEGDEHAEAVARYEAARAQPMGPVSRLIWWIYINYLKGQEEWVARFDPFTTTRLNALPPYDPGRAAVYRKHAYGAMRLWRYFFGIGSLMIGFTVFSAIGRPDIFLLWRLVVLNAIFHLYLKPLQRRASQGAFAELGIAGRAASA